MSPASPPLDRHAAATLVDLALRQVFDPDVVNRLREDSPLTAIGFDRGDAVCVSDAVAAAAAARSLSCVLTDGDLDTVVTVADLVDAAVAAGERSSTT